MRKSSASPRQFLNCRGTYIWGPGIDNLLAIRTGDATYYALTEHQNTVHGFVDAAGVIVARYVYDAWGNVLSETVTVTALAGNRYRFQGREYSAATGLYNFRARWYDPATGRWLSKDPVGLNGGINLYAFCGNDPVNRADPFGLCENCDGFWDWIRNHLRICLFYHEDEDGNGTVGGGVGFTF